jgi:thiamine-phosphate pyrophosphorylase
VNRVELQLYGILDPARSAGRPLPELAAAAVNGGVSILQLRDKTGATRRMVESARAIRAAIAGSGVPLLVNDRVDVALASEAEGVHLGRDDMEPEIARRLLGPSAIVGLTVKEEGHLDDGLAVADYVCIGGVFETLSKDNPAAPVGLAGLSRLVAAARRKAPGMPVGAIAGIDAGNAAEVIAAGADGIAVISALFMAGDVAAEARRLRGIVNQALAARLTPAPAR